MPENEAWVIKGWQKGLTRSIADLNWMGPSYGADSTETEIEAMVQRLATASGMMTLDARTPEELSQAEDLFKLGKFLETRPARYSLSLKHAAWSERMMNGQI